MDDVNDLDRIIRKIKRCLALGKSGNPNEAEMALRQARKLMDAYRLSHADLHVSDVGSEVRSTGKKVTPLWQRYLANAASEAFRCRSLNQLRRNPAGRLESHFLFIGVKPNAELASYAYDSLMTQITTARRSYLATLKTRSGGESRSRGDAFCEAWVYAVGSKVTSFAEDNRLEQEGTSLVALENADSAAIDLWVEQNLGTVGEAARAKEKRRYESDIQAGLLAGAQAELHQGLDENGVPVALGAPVLALTDGATAA
ncbi:DUF2786 domain-containing protein [Geopseudomonas aromaticivorans]